MFVIVTLKYCCSLLLISFVCCLFFLNITTVVGLCFLFNCSPQTFVYAGSLMPGAYCPELGQAYIKTCVSEITYEFGVIHIKTQIYKNCVSSEAGTAFIHFLKNPNIEKVETRYI